MHRSLIALAAGALALGCHDATSTVSPRMLADPTPSAAVGLPLSAEVTFGRLGVGSPFGGPSGHDASIHAPDKILPHTVNIAAGGSVTFNVAPFHTAAVYDRGTEPSDITLSPATLDDLVLAPGVVIPDFIINDPANRIARGPALNPGAPSSWTTPPGTFDVPGTYLVICQVLPHFAGAKMYAYVKVH